MGNLFTGLFGWLSSPDYEGSKHEEKQPPSTTVNTQIEEVISRKSHGGFSLGIEDRGLRFAVLKEIAAIDLNSERIGESLKDEFVKPETAKWACSYSEYIASNNCTSVGPVNVFVSHSWFYTFGHLVSAIEVFEARRTTPTFYFVDYFCINQHKPTADLKRLADMIGICETLLVLSPWDAPIPLTRCWCIYEVLYTILQKRKLHIILPPDQKTLFIQGVIHDFRACTSSLTCINVANAEATKPSDKKMILDTVKNSLSNGFADVNSLLIGALRDWLSDALLERGEQQGKLEQLVKDKRSLLKFYLEAGDWIRMSYQEDNSTERSWQKDAFRLWDLGILMGTRFGMQNERDVVEIKAGKASLLRLQGESELTEAIVLMEQVVEHCRTDPSWENIRLESTTGLLEMKILNALNSNDTKEVHRFETEYIEFALENMDSISKKNPEGGHNAVVKLINAGRYRDAERFQRLILENNGDNENMLYWCCLKNLGVSIYHQRGREAEGEKYLRNVVQKVSVVGRWQAIAMRAQSQLGHCLLLQGQYEEAQENLEKAFKWQNQYGNHNNFTRETVEWLNKVKTARVTSTGKGLIAQSTLDDIVQQN